MRASFCFRLFTFIADLAKGIFNYASKWSDWAVVRVHRAHGQTPPGPDDQSPDFKSWHAGYTAETRLGVTDSPEISRNWGQILARDSSFPGRSKKTGMDTQGRLYGLERFSWKPGLSFIRNQKFAQPGRVWIKHFIVSTENTQQSPVPHTPRTRKISFQSTTWALYPLPCIYKCSSHFPR